MKHFKLKFLAIIMLAITVSSCKDDDDNTIIPEVKVTVPENLTIGGDTFYPEDIVIDNNIVYVSGLGDGTIRTFDLTKTNPTAQLFADAEEGYAQRWGLKTDGKVLLSLLDNANFAPGGLAGPSKLVEYNIKTGEKTNEWGFPATTVAHTVSIVDGKYYISDFNNPRIMEVDPATGTVNDSWFTSTQWDPSIDGNLGGVIYDNNGGFYAYLGFKIWYIPVSNGQPGIMEEVTITGLTGDQINVDGITWVDSQDTLYYASNDTGNPENVGTVYKLVFSDTTTATGSVVTTGLDDTSGVWYLNANNTEYLFVLESQFGGLFGINDFDAPFNIEIIKL